MALILWYSNNRSRNTYQYFIHNTRGLPRGSPHSLEKIRSLRGAGSFCAQILAGLMAGKQQAAQEFRAGRLQRIFCRRPALSFYRTSPFYVFSGTPPAAAAERMLEKAPATACSRDNRCVRPDTGDTGETALLPGTGAKVEAKGLEPLTSR